MGNWSKKRTHRFDEEVRDPEIPSSSVAPFTVAVRTRSRAMVNVGEAPITSSSGTAQQSGEPKYKGTHRRGEPGLHHHPGCITVEDEVATSGPRCSWTPSRKEYISYTLQSEFDINENTLNYIDKQLGEVTVILERARG
jgi:hypothetical protein